MKYYAFYVHRKSKGNESIPVAQEIIDNKLNEKTFRSLKDVLNHIKNNPKLTISFITDEVLFIKVDNKKAEFLIGSSLLPDFYNVIYHDWLPRIMFDSVIKDENLSTSDLFEIVKQYKGIPVEQIGKIINSKNCDEKIIEYIIFWLEPNHHLLDLIKIIIDSPKVSKSALSKLIECSDTQRTYDLIMTCPKMDSELLGEVVKNSIKKEIYLTRDFYNHKCLTPELLESGIGLNISNMRAILESPALTKNIIKDLLNKHISILSPNDVFNLNNSVMQNEEFKSDLDILYSIVKAIYSKGYIDSRKSKRAYTPPYFDEPLINIINNPDLNYNLFVKILDKINLNLEVFTEVLKNERLTLELYDGISCEILEAFNKCDIDKDKTEFLKTYLTSGYLLNDTLIELINIIENEKLINTIGAYIPENFIENINNSLKENFNMKLAKKLLIIRKGNIKEKCDNQSQETELPKLDSKVEYLKVLNEYLDYDSLEFTLLIIKEMIKEGYITKEDCSEDFIKSKTDGKNAYSLVRKQIES